MDSLVTERSRQTGKKIVLCMLGLLSTNIRGRERSDEESAGDRKIALVHSTTEHDLHFLFENHAIFFENQRSLFFLKSGHETGHE